MPRNEEWAFGGGALLVHQALSVLLDSSSFVNNAIAGLESGETGNLMFTAMGGAVAITNVTTAALFNCTFHGNAATIHSVKMTSWLFGGAVSLWQVEKIELQRSRFLHNSAIAWDRSPSYGGAVCVGWSDAWRSVNVLGCTFAFNQVFGQVYEENENYAVGCGGGGLAVVSRHPVFIQRGLFLRNNVYLQYGFTDVLPLGVASGGGLFVGNTSLLLLMEETVVRYNVVDGRYSHTSQQVAGGGVSCISLIASLVMIDCQVSANSLYGVLTAELADSTGFTKGGGIYFSDIDGSLILIRTTVAYNLVSAGASDFLTSTTGGGGIAVDIASNINVTDSSIDGNFVFAPSFPSVTPLGRVWIGGGGLLIRQLFGWVEIHNSTLNDNRIYQGQAVLQAGVAGGGAAINSQHRILIDHSSISNNEIHAGRGYQKTCGGGGLAIFSGSCTIHASQINNNMLLAPLQEATPIPGIRVRTRLKFLIGAGIFLTPNGPNPSVSPITITESVFINNTLAYSSFGRSSTDFLGAAIGALSWKSMYINATRFHSNYIHAQVCCNSTVLLACAHCFFVSRLWLMLEQLVELSLCKILQQSLWLVCRFRRILSMGEKAKNAREGLLGELSV